MAFALQADGVNDYVTVDFPVPFFNGSTYDHTWEFECASVSGSDYWIVGTSSNSREIIELEPSNNRLRVRFDNSDNLFDLSGSGITYDNLNVYRVRGWFDGTTRRVSLHVNDVLIEQKDGVADARAGTSHNQLFRILTNNYLPGLLSYISMTDVNDSTNDRFYDARNTSSGSSLPETTANAGDGTLVNFPGDDSQWVDQGGGGTTVAIGLASDSDSAFSISAINPRTYSIGIASESDQAFSISALAPSVVSLGLATETDSAFSISAVIPKVVSVGAATETDQAFAITPVITSGTVVFLGTATESSQAFGLTKINPRTYELGLAVEADQALTVRIAGQETPFLKLELSTGIDSKGVAVSGIINSTGPQLTTLMGDNVNLNVEFSDDVELNTAMGC